MSDRREPTISALSLDKEPLDRQSLDKESLSREPLSRAIDPQFKPTARAAPAYTASTMPAQAPAQSSSVGLVALIFALFAGGLGGFIFYQLQQTQRTLVAAQQSLTAAETRIVELEKRLTMTGDESTQSLATLQINIKENASEIKKLWDVANVRTKNSISALEQKMQNVQKTADAIEPKLTAAIDGKIKQSLQEVSGEVSVLGELLEGQQQKVASVEKTAQKQVQSVEGLKSKIDKTDAELRNRMQVNEEAIRSMDAFRLQVNRQLIELKGG